MNINLHRTRILSSSKPISLCYIRGLRIYATGNNKWHIATDIGSKIIRRRNFGSATPHDSQYRETLLSGDEQAIFGDSAYGNKTVKRHCRQEGIYYGILDKATRSKKLSNRQKNRNKKTKSTISRKTSICVYEGETQL